MAPGSRRSGCLEPFLITRSRSLDPRAYKPPHLPETFPSPTSRECACVLCAEYAWCPTTLIPSTGTGGTALLDGPRQCSSFSNPPCCSKLAIVQSYRRLEIALGIWSCATLLLSIQLGVPEIPVPVLVLLALSHVDLPVAQNLFVAIAVAVKATQVTQQHGYTIDSGTRWRPTSSA